MKVTFRCDPALEAHLPRPVPARERLPDWLRAMPPAAFSGFHGQEIRTVKQCPPFVDAMMAGFLIPLPCDLRVEAGRFAWDWDLPEPSLPGHPRSPLSFHVAAQLAQSPLQAGERPAIKFNSFWTIELEPGWALLALHPLNRLDLPFRTLAGLVDADRFNEVGIFFPALWTEPGFAGLLPRGTPVVQCVPVRREPVELAFGTIAGERAQAFARLSQEILSEPGIYRRRYRARRSGEQDRD